MVLMMVIKMGRKKSEIKKIILITIGKSILYYSSEKMQESIQLRWKSTTIYVATAAKPPTQYRQASAKQTASSQIIIKRVQFHKSVSSWKTIRLID